MNMSASPAPSFSGHSSFTSHPLEIPDPLERTATPDFHNRTQSMLAGSGARIAKTKVRDGVDFL